MNVMRKVFHKHMIDRYNLQFEDGNPVVKCWTYERIAKLWNHVRSNKPNWLREIKDQKQGSCNTNH